MTNATNQWIKTQRKKLIKLFGGKCYFCGSTRFLVFAHRWTTPILEARKQGKAGRKERFYDVVNHPKAYLLTCRKHNKMAWHHKGRVKKVDMSNL